MDNLGIDTALMGCLENLVGITRSQCNCYPTLPTDNPKADLIQKSISGLYIDEEPHINNSLLLSKEKCGTGDIFDKIIAVRRLAIQQVVMDVSTELQLNLQPEFDKMINWGDSQYGNQLQGLPAGRKSIFLQTKNYVGGMINLSQSGFLALLPDGVWSTTVRIGIKKAGEDVDLFYTNFRIDNVTAWSMKRPDTSYFPLPQGGINLPTDGTTYELYYDYDPTQFIPYSNKVGCYGCLKNITGIENFFVTIPQGEAFGMMFSARLFCNPMYLICSLVSKNMIAANIVSQAIQIKTLELLIFKLRAEQSGVLNVPQILQLSDGKTSDTYQELLMNYAIMYNDYISKLKANAAFYDTKIDCFTCRKGYYGQRTGIIR